eukprot:CAMPEP_0197534540 /NCGR_PEP_ID=MMETSP1318-20131121/47510_1 /TAXON_ID=552666 /ORGANISM="Partenskyella glossopodia, Strain RCC365" /LENGTH=158 /DNA_ID=CAMNT_0043091853 /DNA_START=52 /DNA_END=525 /DNA_ORIENTATION=+
MDIAKYASLATLARNQKGTINSRIIFPKPTNATAAPKLEKIYFATNVHSRKYQELSPTYPDKKPATINLCYYDTQGVGYVSIRGVAYECDKSESTKEYWDGWDAVYPDGSSTDFYTLIRIVPDHIEFASYNRFHVDTGRNRSDWAPFTLTRDRPDQDW